MWGQVRAFASRKVTPGPFPQLFIDGSFVNDRSNVTNAFAKHFADASSADIYAPDVNRTLIAATNSLDFSSENLEPYNVPFTLRELKLSLAKSNDKTSVGPDGIPYSFFTNLDELNLSSLLIAFNNLWVNDHFPDEWLRSIIIPISKPGKDPHLTNSYRPISLTNCICKIFERMVNARLRYYLEKNCYIDACQSGFRKNRSTADNVVRLISDVQVNWEHRRPTVAVFLDLVSAFNKVHTSTVLNKVYSIGIRGHLASFLRNFLKPRTFKVRCQATPSDDFVMEHGVTQGSVLSPTLFLIALNDILLSLPRVLTFSVRYSLFADDIAIWVSHKNYNQAYSILQKVLDHCTNWCAKWGFFLSAPKSVMMVFKRGPRPSLDGSPRINGIPIPFQTSHKFLGIILDSNLTYRAHVGHIRARCIKRMNALRCISGFTWGADRKTLLMLYIGLIRSTIEYNCYLFSTISPTLCRRLEAIQSSCLRLITGAFRTSPILALRAETNLPALEHRRLFLFLRYYYRTKCVPNHAAVPAMEARKPQTRHPLRRSCFLPGILEAAHQLLNVPHANVASNPPPTPFWLIESMSIIYLFDFRKASLSPVEAQLLFQEYMAQNIDSAFFYTDGSCHGHQVGSAAVGPGLRFGIRLPDFTTVFSAEVYAIGKVIEHIKMQKIEQATICTDSKSALQALERIDNVTHHGVRNIHKTLSDLEENQHVTFLWIPGHYGIAGNERADTLAKEGAMQPHPVAEPMGQGDIIHMIRIKFAEYLQSQWDQHHAPHLYAIKRTLKSWSACNQQDKKNALIILISIAILPAQQYIIKNNI